MRGSATRRASAVLTSTKRIGQPLPSTHKYLFNSEDELTPGILKSEYKSRRDRFFDQLPDNTVAVLFGAAENIMTNDIPNRFRQNTDFYYLTGFQEPDAVAVFQKKSSIYTNKYLLFVRPLDPLQRIWDGDRAGLEVARDVFGANESYDTEEDLTDILSSIYHRNPNHQSATKWFIDTSNIHPQFNNQLLLPFVKLFPDSERSGGFKSPRDIIERLRHHKSPAEIEIMKKSSNSSSHAFHAAMHVSQGGNLSQWNIEAELEYQVKKMGSQRLAYPPVVASGNNNNILHYVNNDEIVQNGELILCDAGGELYNYSTDITRVWPCSGKFTKAQRTVYEHVLNIQKECVNLVKVGSSQDEIHKFSVSETVKALMDLGVLDKSKGIRHHIEKRSYNKFYPHRVGHWLGMDVHDTTGISPLEKFQGGEVVTIEPGLYLDQDHDEVPEEFKGIGIRIEDDVLVVKEGKGREVLTWETVKEVEDIERAVAGEKVVGRKD